MPDYSANNAHPFTSSYTEPSIIHTAKPLIDLDQDSFDWNEEGISAIKGAKNLTIDAGTRAAFDASTSFPASEQRERAPPPILRPEPNYSPHDFSDGQAIETDQDLDMNMDTAPPIPIPVPRSQTPQLAAEPSASQPAPPAQSSHTHGRQNINPEHMSYGYGFSPISHSSTAVPPRPSKSTKLSQTNVSGLARTIRASITNRAISPSNKRFAAPLPFTRLEEGTARAAPAVVDLGTAGRGFETDKADEDACKAGVEDVQWSRWDSAIIASEAKRGNLRLLLIAYRTAFKIWNVTDVGSISEVLHLPLASLNSSARNEPLGKLVHAAILPRKPFFSKHGPAGYLEQDQDQPRIGLAFDTGAFIIYSLKTHRIVHRFNVAIQEGQGGKGGSRIAGFEVNKDFLIVSATNPPTLHVISTTNFHTLAIIPSSQLMPYFPPLSALSSTSVGGAAGAVSSASASAAAMLSNAFAGAVNLGSTYSLDQDHTRSSLSGRQPHVHSSNTSSSQAFDPPTYSKPGANTPSDSNLPDALYDTNTLHANANDDFNARIKLPSYNNVSLQHTGNIDPPQLLRAARPVYALSHRLLAYAAPGPRPSHGSTPPISTSGLLRDMPTSAQTELARIGGNVWGGMRTLGSLAVSAARNRIGNGGKDARPDTGGASIGRFFSRSAPEGRRSATADEERDERETKERRYSGVSTATSTPPGAAGPKDATERTCHITVVDLRPLLLDGGTSPETVLELSLPGDRPVSFLKFSPDGCSLGIVPKDGQSVQVFQLRPAPKVPSRPGSRYGTGDGHGKDKTGSTWHIYNLRRGRTNAIVDSLEWTEDGRWLAIGTMKRTIHIFGVNPYGGKTDPRSHLEGRVRNTDDLHPMPTDMFPIARLRATLTPTSDQARSPLAFTFTNSYDTPLPGHLLPPHAPPLAHTSRLSDAGRSPPMSPPSKKHRPSNFQDIMLFDPLDNSLGLRRLMLDLRPRDQGMSLVGSAAAAVGATSISLPGMGAVGRLSGSPSSGSGTTAAGSLGQGPLNTNRQTTNRTVETPMELIARDSTVMTWSLASRNQDLHIVLGDGADSRFARGKTNKDQTDLLSHAELSMFSRSIRMLPRPIYLMHQFSFHTLGEDYHALIRRYQLSIGGLRIDVRKEVQVNAYSAGGESFVEGFAPTRDYRIRNISSSFDEPLASALNNELEHTHAPGILPMLPNGMPTSRPQSFRNAIPIRTIGDGMSESLSRIRREISKVRSPSLKPRPDSSISASVPLEFDEEDEDFMQQGVLDALELGETSAGGGDLDFGVPAPAANAYTLDDRNADTEKADDAWGGWSLEDKLAVEEVERFDTIDVLGLLDEEQVSIKEAVKRKRKTKRRT